MNRLFFFLLVFLVSCTTAFSQDFIPAPLLKRTFHIEFEQNRATSFLTDYNGENYFITAKHLFSGAEKKISFIILSNTERLKVVADVFFHENPLVDIAVIKPHNWKKTDAIPLTTSNLTLGDNGFFLGYPLGLRAVVDSSVHQNFPLPLIKRANLSAVVNENDVTLLWLDGLNNKGFSGGPVFFKNRDIPNDNNWYLAGVISSYITQRNQIKTSSETATYEENSGIIEVMGARHIIEIIESIK